jgi:hypothetical protein
MKIILKVFIFFLFLFSLDGCVQYGNAPKGPPSEDDVRFWKKANFWEKEDDSEVGKAMLECGFKTLRGFGDGISNRCMIKSGFINTKVNYCPKITPIEKQRNNNNLLQGSSGILFLACELSENEIPDRNISKRLTSDYCKYSKESIYCKP